MKHEAYRESDDKAIQLLNSFLPEKIFDAHAHLCYKLSEDGGDPEIKTTDEYIHDMMPLFGDHRTLSANLIPFPYKNLIDEQGKGRDLANQHLKNELTLHSENIGEILIFPTDSAENIEKQLDHPGIRGLKCYFFYANAPQVGQADIGEYLPESAWEVAQKHKLAITLHLAKDASLSDPENLSYIKTMAKRYPDATLILAHVARGFAAWTCIESVAELAPFENIYFDFSAVCESPAMVHTINKVGIHRCMWGSDYPILIRGKAISLANSFYWIGEDDMKNFGEAFRKNSWLYPVENLMATRQACILCNVKESAVEDLFYNNAKALFGLGKN